jgi:FkbM family methyltransferase
VPSNHLAIVKNVIANDAIGRITPKLLGLGASAGSMVVPAEIGGRNLALPSSVSIGSTFSAGVSVPIDTLDREMVSFAGRVVVKIDVEGFEAEVLEGGREFIREHKPFIICEILGRAPRTADIAEQLKQVGYTFAVFTDAGLKERPTVAYERAGRDWLFIPPSA